MEIWKQSKSAPKYEVSNFGNIRNLKTKKQLNSKKLCSKNKYIRVIIQNKENIRKIFSLHRLIAEAFLNLNIEDKTLLVDHIDRNKLNNNVSNLRIVNYSDNSLNIEKYNHYLAFNLNTHKSYLFDNQRLFSEKTNVDKTDIMRCIKNDQNQIKGWIIKKIDFEVKDFNYCNDFKNKEIIINLINFTPILDNDKIKAICPVLAKNIITNEEYIFNNKKLFSKKFNVTQRYISDGAKNNDLVHKNWKFKYLDFTYKINPDEIINLRDYPDREYIQASGNIQIL